MEQLEFKSEIRIAPSGLMDLENAAKYLGVKCDTMRFLRRTKQLPFVRIGAKLYLKQHDLDSYIERMTEPAR